MVFNFKDSPTYCYWRLQHWHSQEQHQQKGTHGFPSGTKPELHHQQTLHSSIDVYTYKHFNKSDSWHIDYISIAAEANKKYPPSESLPITRVNKKMNKPVSKVMNKHTVVH